MKYFIFIISLIIDILLFLFLFTYEKYLIQVLILHVLLYFIAYRMYLKFDKQIEELPFYVVLFMPGLGIIIFTLFYFSINYFYRDNQIISDYEQMLDFNRDKDRIKKINYENEVKTMSYLDMLNFIDPEKKKDILIESQYNHQINNVKILRKGLEAQDREVQHYSATLLNSRENEMVNNISSIREHYNETHDEFILDDLIDAYKTYLASNLIEEDSLVIFYKEYSEVLNKKISLKHYGINILNELFNVYISLNDLYNATLIYYKIEREFPNDISTKVNNINLLYTKGAYAQLLEYLNNLTTKDFEDSEKLGQLKLFFGEGDRK